MTDSVSLLKKNNPWWSTKKVPADLIRFPDRRELNECLRLISERQILILKGIKGSGKSSIVFNMADRLLKMKIEPERIILIDLSDELGKPVDIIKNYTKEKLGIEVQNLNNDIYVFFLNAQYRKNISDEIKEMISSSVRLKIVLSASAEFVIDEKVEKENMNLIGALNITPLNFVEYLSLQKHDVLKHTFSIAKILDFEFFRVEKGGFKRLENKIGPGLDSFLFSTSLSEFLNITNPLTQKKEIKSNVLDSVIYKDMHLLYDVKFLSLMEKIYQYLCRTSTEVSNQLKISQKFKVSYPSLLNYLKYFEKSYLLNSTRNYYIGTTNEKRTNRKFFVSDFGFIDDSDECYFNKVKSLIFNHCFKIAIKNGWEMYYWQHFRSSIEILLDIGDSIIPLDVSRSSFNLANSSEKKIKSNVSIDNGTGKTNDKDLRGLIIFLTKNKYERGVLITKNEFEIRKFEKCEIMLIPLWWFLLSD